MNIDKLIDGIFTEAELQAFQHVKPMSVDVEELEKTGKVTLLKNEEDGFITETLKYKSFAGDVSFTKTNSYYKHNSADFKDKVLNEQIEFAVNKEHYEKAALLQKQLTTK